MAAVLFNMIGGSEIIFDDIEKYFAAHGLEFKQSTKQLFNEFMRAAKRLKYLYQQMTRYAVSCAVCAEDIDPGEAYLADCNTVARTMLQLYDATHLQDDTTLLKIESTFKMFARHPRFGSEFYDRYHTQEPTE